MYGRRVHGQVKSGMRNPGGSYPSPAGKGRMERRGANGMKIRVFLADDHIVFRQGLKTLLEDTDDVTVIGEADDGRKAVDMITRAWPDVALMDIGMPELNGIEATRQILKGNGRVKIIGLSMHVNERFVGEMLRAGASGYLCKQCDADEVLMAIRVVM
ncbi:MAG: response regulator transcription factor, partial [Spartobacteria bacterium]|nr:response regulator transcription factor [Spartobacteria bacterium]